ncbi:MAG: PKD domain-containing protein, partial [Chitinophagaceae bacterium]
LSWEWHFGDGGISAAQNPSHTYSNYGNYNDTLIVTNAFGCTDTLIRPNYVRIQRATIGVPSLPARGCIPYTITPTAVINSVDAVTSYFWDFGDGGTSVAANPTYTFLSQGTYTIKLFITTSSGCTDSLIIPDAIRVGSKPVADFSASPNPVCARQPVQFTDLSVPADEWDWDFGDGGVSFTQHPLHNYNDTGYFDIRLIAFNNGCPDTSAKVRYIYVNPPIARFIATPDCGNRLRFTFTDQSVAPLTWEWDFGDASPLVFTQNPVHIFPALGTYNVRLVVTNAGCADTTFFTINTVNENPDFIADITEACKIATIQFQTTNIIPANIVNYDWDFGNGGTASVGVPNVGFAYPTTGNFTVRLRITDINGCTNTITKTNYIRINGPLVFFNANNTAGCMGLTTSFTDLSATDGVNSLVNWEWIYGDGTSQTYTSPPFQHTYNTAGTFSVKLIVTDAAGCIDSTTNLNIITATDPIPDFISPDTLSCPGAPITFTNTTTPAGFSSEWSFGDGNSSLLLSPTHNYSASGFYDIKLIETDGYGCADSITKTNYIRIDTPLANFAVNDSISSCLPFEVQFTNTSSYYSSVLWNFGPGQGTSALNNPVHYYSVAGTYLVKLIITSLGGCLDSITNTIQVFDTVGTTIDYLPLSGCKPIQMSLNSFTTGPIASYYWDFGDGYTQITTTPNVNHIYSSFGSFLPKV